MEDKINKILEKINLLDKISVDIEGTKEEIKEFKKDFSTLNDKIAVLENKIETQENDIARLERLTRRNNLVIYGMPETETSQTDLENKIISLLKQYIKVELSTNDFNEVLRIGKVMDSQQRKRPIRVCFISTKTKNLIYSERKSMKGSGMFISHDLSKQELQNRKEKWSSYNRQNELQNNSSKRPFSQRQSSEESPIKHMQKNKIYKQGTRSEDLSQQDKNQPNRPNTLSNFLLTTQGQ